MESNRDFVCLRLTTNDHGKQFREEILQHLIAVPDSNSLIM